LKEIQGKEKVCTPGQTKSVPSQRIEAIRHWVKAKPGSSNFIQARDAAIVALGFRAMLRPGELAKMKLADWKDLKGKVYLRIGRSKADQKAERKPIVLEAVKSEICPVKLIREYLVWRAIKGFADKEQMFVSEKGGRMSTAGISSVVKRVAKTAGLEGLGFARRRALEGPDQGRWGLEIRGGGQISAVVQSRRSSGPGNGVLRS